MLRSLRLVCSAAIVSALSGFAHAHHSQAGIFDSRQTIEVTGVIKSISWRNPHGQILLEVMNTDGSLTEWDAETASIAVLRNRGAEPSAVVVGDKVTIAGAPSVRGRFGLRGMQERALAIGADVAVTARDDGPGTSVRLTLPVAAAHGGAP